MSRLKDNVHDIFIPQIAVTIAQQLFNHHLGTIFGQVLSQNIPIHIINRIFLNYMFIFISCAPVVWGQMILTSPTVDCSTRNDQHRTKHRYLPKIHQRFLQSWLKQDISSSHSCWKDCWNRTIWGFKIRPNKPNTLVFVLKYHPMEWVSVESATI